MIYFFAFEATYELLDGTLDELARKEGFGLRDALAQFAQCITPGDHLDIQGCHWPIEVDIRQGEVVVRY